MVKSCDLKALVGLMGEAQLKREDLYLIGIPCTGVLDRFCILPRC